MITTTAVIVIPFALLGLGIGLAVSHLINTKHRANNR